MVGAVDLCVDFSIFNAVAQSLTGYEVVDAPPCVLLAGLKAVGPPRVGYLLWIEGAEGVDEATGKEVAEFLTLGIRKACVHAVGFGIFQVYFLVCHVEVATEDDGLLGIELLEIVAEIVLPCHAVVQSLEPIL